ncbi:MAG: YcbK family protein [Geminicoccaceae bacterium]
MLGSFTSNRANAAVERRLALYNIHTHECVDVCFVQDGAYNWPAIAKIDWLMRDWRRDEIRPMDVRLFDQLVTLQRRLGTEEPFDLICGYRSPETNAWLLETGHQVARQSLHLVGRAVDVRLPGQTLSRLRTEALEMKAGGVGYYPGSDFVHLDTGRIRSW